MVDELHLAIGGQAGADEVLEGGAQLLGVLLAHQPEADLGEAFEGSTVLNPAPV
jgi:hypothetical protein